MITRVVRDRFGSINAVLSAYLLAQSQRIAGFLDRRITLLMAIWFALAALAGSIKILYLIAIAPKAATLATVFALIIPYALIALAPSAGYMVVVRCFATGAMAAQPRLRLAKLGSWSSVSPGEARQHQNFGMSGLLVSLVAGLLLNLVMRLGEYVLAMPAIPRAAAPWAQAMFDAVTFDLIYLSFLYSVCIAMALRVAPLFPRMLVYTWLCDILMQVAIARYTIGAGGLPGEVAAPLQFFLDANIKKVMISVVLWLPYLLVSNRVNITFRQRVRREPVLAV